MKHIKKVGIIYLMTTVVDVLIKIGKTKINNFDKEMKDLERNGYFNVSGLKRNYAIKLENYDEKEKNLFIAFFQRVKFQVVNYLLLILL